MTEMYATAEECRPLFTLMAEVKQMAPWEWMTETDIFGVQGVGDGEPDFVSVMGMAGEHYAVALYLGLRGLFEFWYFQQNQAHVQPEDLLLLPQLQLSFDDREVLDSHDRNLLKGAGVKPRGRNAWPRLRSHRPGLLPWHITSAEVNRLRVALAQLLDVAPRFKANQKLILVGGQNRFLVRVAEQQGDQVVWRDEVQKLTQPPPTSIDFTISTPLLAKVKQLPRVYNNLEIDLFLMPTPIHEREGRPYFPFNLLVAESKSGQVLSTDLLQPLPSLAAMQATVPERIMQLLITLGVIPNEIHLTSPILLQLLHPLTKEVGFQLKEKKRLPMLDSAKRGMLQMMGRFSR